MTSYDNYIQRFEAGPWVPKELRINIVPCSDEVRGHAGVLFSNMSRDDRQQALDAIKALIDATDSNGAVAVLAQFAEWKEQN